MSTGPLGLAAIEVRDVSADGARVRLPVHVLREGKSLAAQVRRNQELHLTLLAPPDFCCASRAEVRWHREQQDGSLEAGLRFPLSLPDEVCATAASRADV